MTTDSLSLLKAVRAIHLRNPNNHYEKNGTIEEIEAQTAALLPNPDELETSERARLTICLAAHRAAGGCTTPGENLIDSLVLLYAEKALTPEDVRWKAREFDEDFEYVSGIAEKQALDFPPERVDDLSEKPQSTADQRSQTEILNSLRQDLASLSAEVDQLMRQAGQRNHLTETAGA